VSTWSSYSSEVLTDQAATIRPGRKQLKKFRELGLRYIADGTEKVLISQSFVSICIVSLHMPISTYALSCRNGRYSTRERCRLREHRQRPIGLLQNEYDLEQDQHDAIVIVLDICFI